MPTSETHAGVALVEANVRGEILYREGVALGLDFFDGSKPVPEVERFMLRCTSWRPPSSLWRVPPYAIGGIASFWVMQRVAAF